MHKLYDTSPVPGPDRYAHYRDGARAELAPVSVQGPSPVRLHAVMAVAQIGEFELETITWQADSEVVARRTGRLIRASDPECYRILLCVRGGVRMEQAERQMHARDRDMALYDLSLPWVATHATGQPMRVVMLTIPRGSLPFDRDTVVPLLGRPMPRDLPGRDLVAQLLIELTDTDTDDPESDPGLAEVLREGAIGLIRQQLGHPDGFTPRARLLVQTARIRGIIRRQLATASLNPDEIAQAATMSLRSLHKTLQDAGSTPMQMLKQFRLEACRRAIEDPALSEKPIKDLIAAYGYLRQDQFARDFKRLFGVSARQLRESSAYGRDVGVRLQ